MRYFGGEYFAKCANLGVQVRLGTVSRRLAGRVAEAGWSASFDLRRGTVHQNAVAEA